MRKRRITWHGAWVDVSSFDNTMEDALANLKEAVVLYFEDEEKAIFFPLRFDAYLPDSFRLKPCQFVKS